jgi:hypothetical protein
MANPDAPDDLERVKRVEPIEDVAPIRTRKV